MKNVLILCNGRPPSHELFHEFRARSDLFIAADGGGNIARTLDAMPDIVIGDMDSFVSHEEETVEINHQPGQETNDLEKALIYARENEGTHINILGATGYRLDHTLKNLSVLIQFHSHFEDIVLHDDYGTTKLLTKEFVAQLPVGTQISLFPLSGKVEGVHTKGLKYPLEKETLENGVRDGSSNEVVSNPVKITHEVGDLLLFVAR